MAVRGRFRVEEEATDVSSSEVASGNARFLPLISRGGSWIDNPEDCGGNVTRRALGESHEGGRSGSRRTREGDLLLRRPRRLFFRLSPFSLAGADSTRSLGLIGLWS